MHHLRSKRPASKEDMSQRDSSKSSGNSQSLYSERFRHFPMLVVPIAYVLERMSRIESHEELLEKDVLVEYTPGMGPVTFMSHTWLSHSHPDPRNEKLALLKGFLRGALEGNITVKVWWFEHFLFGNQTISAEALQSKVQGGFCWIDFCSVPQQDREGQLKAVMSIPSYVADSALFVIAAPPSMHQETGAVSDVRALLRRGWCRMERISNELSPEPKKCIVLQSPTSRFVGMSRDWLFSPVGLAQFAVEADKDVLGPVILDLLVHRQTADLANQDLTSYRLLESMKRRLLEGCEVQHKVLIPYTYMDWMEKMKFKDAREDEASGWTPLRYALYEGQLGVARELLARGADVKAPLRQAHPGKGYHFIGCTILHGLSFLRDAPKEIEMLLAARASPWDRDEHGNTALHLAFGGGCCANIDAIMKSDPTVAGAFDFHGNPVTNHAIVVGCREAFVHFRSNYPEHLMEPSKEHELGFGFVSRAVCDAGDYDTVVEVIKAGYEVDMQSTHNPKDTILPVVCKVMQALCYFTEPPESYVEWVANQPGRTALMDACYFGNLRVAALLMERGASLSKTNCYGRTALHFAAMQGHRHVVVALLQAGASRSVKDTWGRSPADWADHRGHAEVGKLIRDLSVGSTAATSRRRIIESL